MSKYNRIATEVLNCLGGPENIESFTNCMTRLRVTPKNKSLIKHTEVKKIEGVLGVVDEGSYQVILGPGVVTKVAEEFGIILKNAGWSGANMADNLKAKGADIKQGLKEKNNTPFKNFLRKIGNVFIPLIPAFVGSGIIAGIASILSNNIVAGNLDAADWQQYVTILNVIKSGVFSYLVIYVGIQAAKEFGATPSLGGVIGGTALLTGVLPENPIMNIFTNTPLAPGQGGIIGVLLAVWILSIVETRLRKVVPDALDIIVTPAIALLVVGLINIFLIMPFAGFVSSNLVGSINWVLDQGGPFAGFVLAGTFLPLVMLGLHQVLTPIHIEMIGKTGSTQLLPILAMAGAGQVGAAIALYVRCRKNKPLTNIIKGSLPVGILGIGEPLIYGVTLPLGRPFITACIGGGIGGATIGLLGNIGATAIGPSGIALIPLISGGAMKFIIGLFAAYIGGFVVTYFFGVPKEAMEEQ